MADSQSVQEMLEAAERAAAKEAIEKIAEKHINGVLELREQIEIDDAHLTSKAIANDSRIDVMKRKELGTLQNRIKGLIDHVAKKIKDSQYSSLELSLEEAGIPMKKRRIGQELVDSVKEIEVCHHGLLLTIALLTEFNVEIGERLKRNEEQLKATGGQSGINRREHQNLLFANAVLVYEVYDYLISYFQSYSVTGIEDVESIYKRCIDDIQSTREKLKRNRDSVEQKLRAGQISKEHSDFALTEIEQQDSALQRVTEEWDRLVEDVRKPRSKDENVRSQIPLFEVFRDNAGTQIEVLSAISILQAVQGGFEAMNSAEKLLKEMELVPLDLERVNLLLSF